MKTFETGSQRGTDADGTRYDLISPVALRRLAETTAEGAVKYGEGNFLKGIPANDLLNHAMKHIEQWRSGDRSEDHLAHAMWNLHTIMHFEETKPDMLNGLVYREDLKTAAAVTISAAAMNTVPGESIADRMAQVLNK